MKLAILAAIQAFRDRRKFDKKMVLIEARRAAIYRMREQRKHHPVQLIKADT